MMTQINPSNSMDRGASKSAFLLLLGLWQASVSSLAVRSASVVLQDDKRQSSVKSKTCVLVQRHVVFATVLHSDCVILDKTQVC